MSWLFSYVIANDLSPAATVAMRRNVDLNGLGPTSHVEAEVGGPSSAVNDAEGVPEPNTASAAESSKRRKPIKSSLGKVQVNEGDAWCAVPVTRTPNPLAEIVLLSDLMYSHRQERSRVDVVDLDPYGTAAPFIDAAVQCVKDDGQTTTLFVAF